MIRDINFALGANESVSLYVVGTFVRYRSGNGDVQIEPPDQGVALLSTGNKIRYGTPFQKLTLTNPAASAIAGTLIIGDGDFQDDRITGEVSVTKSAIAIAPADVVLNAGGVTTIRNQALTRREILVTNLAANTEILRIAGTAGGTAANRGIELAPGQTVVLHTNATVSGWNPGAVAQSVAVLELFD